MKPLLLLVVMVLSHMAVAQGTPRDTAYCFTRAELEAAADSALKGQAAVRSLTLAFVLAASHKEEALSLRKANGHLAAALDASKQEAMVSGDRVDRLELLYTKSEAKARRRGGWVLGLGLSTALLTLIILAP